MVSTPFSYYTDKFYLHYIINSGKEKGISKYVSASFWKFYYIDNLARGKNLKRNNPY